MNTQFIFITGGVSSSLGKGIIASSLACLLESQGLKVSLQKMDPYINIDAGTMSPYQHGEVYVTQDGHETDLDLGNYERFTSVRLTKKNSLTTGQIYQNVILKERQGFYEGKTVQVIPHITDEIQERILDITQDDQLDILIIEVGGTVGDIESIPFLEAIRQFALRVGKKNTLYLHLTLLPWLNAAEEIKTKPSQHSIQELNSLGIQPDILLCRTTVPISDEIRTKLSLTCSMEKESVIEVIDIKKTIYEVPILCAKEGLPQIVARKLNLNLPKPDLQCWEHIVNVYNSPKYHIKVGVIGKYIMLKDAYKSLYEAINHGAINNNCLVEIVRIQSEDITDDNVKSKLQGLDTAIIAGGFGKRGVEGKVKACRYLRENNIPTLGICYGLQCMVIEFARNVCHMDGASSTEVAPDTLYPVICLLQEQKKVMNLGNTMRLGLYETRIEKNSKTFEIYQSEYVRERHRHRYEMNPEYINILSSKGLRVVGYDRHASHAEIVELDNHPWYIGIQYHPEFESKPTKAHPLFQSLIHTAISKKSKILDI